MLPCLSLLRVTRWSCSLLGGGLRVGMEGAPAPPTPERVVDVELGPHHWQICPPFWTLVTELLLGHLTWVPRSFKYPQIRWSDFLLHDHMLSSCSGHLCLQNPRGAVFLPRPLWAPDSLPQRRAGVGQEPGRHNLQGDHGHLCWTSPDSPEGPPVTFQTRVWPESPRCPQGAVLTWHTGHAA